ncbi:MAG: hypothetical protein ACHQEM_08100 [Chitinophagales bacterium]
MKIIERLLYLLFICPSGQILAQDGCSNELIMQVNGSWKKISDANLKWTRDQTAILSRIDQISVFFKDAYPQPKGIEASWYRTMTGYPLTENGPIPYDFNSLYKAWYCNQNLHKMMPGDETGTWAYVYVNTFNNFLSNQYDQLQIQSQGNPIYLLPRKIGEWKGYNLFECSAWPGKNHCILLTHNDRLPWKPVSEEQYLKAVRLGLEDQKSKSSGDDALQEENIKKSMADNQNNQYIKDADKTRINASLQKRLDDMQKSRGANSATMNRYWDDKIAKIDDYVRKNSSSTLVQPAIIDQKIAGSFDGNFSTIEKGGRMLVVVSQEYVNTRLPNYVPQLMILLWRWDNNMPVQEFKKQFEANFPVEKLKAMLDK